MKALLALAALSLMGAAPVKEAPQPTQITIPVDTVARAKFPHDNAEAIDTLAFLNKLVNASITPMSDQEHYGLDDMWVMAPKDGKGDCEDYALTKLFLLQRADFPIVTNTKIVAVIIHYKNGDVEGHAILAVLLPSGDVLYMDSLRTEPATRAELEAHGYQFFDWKA